VYNKRSYFCFPTVGTRGYLGTAHSFKMGLKCVTACTAKWNKRESQRTYWKADWNAGRLQVYGGPTDVASRGYSTFLRFRVSAVVNLRLPRKSRILYPSRWTRLCVKVPPWLHFVLIDINDLPMIEKDSALHCQANINLRRIEGLNQDHIKLAHRVRKRKRKT